MYSHKTAASLRRNAPVAYPVHRVRLHLNAKQWRCLLDHGQTLLGILLLDSRETKIGGINAGLVKIISRYGFSSLEGVALQTAISHKSSSSSLKKRIRVLSQAVLSLLKPLREGTDKESEVTLREGKVSRGLARVVSYYYANPETKDMSSI